MDLDVNITRDGEEPWGFRMIGGIDFNMPLTVVKISPLSPADLSGLENGDTVIRINGLSAEDMTHEESRKAVAAATDILSLGVVRGLYDLVIEESDLVEIDQDLEQEDFDQPSRPTEVFAPLEFTDRPTLVNVPDYFDNKERSRSLTCSPYLVPSKPYRPFSTEPLDEIPAVEEPIILNPEYHDVWPEKLLDSKKNEWPDLLVDEDFLPKTRFKLPISAQYIPDGTKDNKGGKDGMVVTDKKETVKDKTCVEIRTDTVEKSSKISKQDVRKEVSELTTSISEMKSEVITNEDVSFMKNMKQDIDLNKIELTASAIVNESIEKAIAVSEEIRKEIDVEIKECINNEIITETVEKEVQKYQNAVAEKDVAIKAETIAINETVVESKLTVGQVDKLVSLIDETTEDITKQRTAKAEVNVAREVQKIESAEKQVESNKAAEERKQSIKQGIEEIVEVGSVKKKSEIFEKEVAQEVVQKRKESRIEEKHDIESDSREEIRKTESAAKTQVSEDNKTGIRDKKTSVTTERNNDKKYSISKLLAEQRAYTIGLQTIPNIRGSIHSSYHYNLLLKTFFIHLTDVMVALARFILTEPVLDKDESVIGQETVTKTKVTNERNLRDENTYNEVKTQRNEKSVAKSVTAENEVKAVEVERKISSATKQSQEVKNEKNVPEFKKEVKAAEEKKITEFKDEVAVIKAVQAKALEEKVSLKETFQENHDLIEMTKHRISGSEMAQRVEKKSGEVIQTMGAVIHEFQNKAGIEEIVQATSEAVESFQENIGNQGSSRTDEVVDTHSKSKKNKTIYKATVESHVYTNKDAVLLEQLSGGSSIAQSPEEVVKEAIGSMVTEARKKEVAKAVIEAAEEKSLYANSTKTKTSEDFKVTQNAIAANKIVESKKQENFVKEVVAKQSVVETKEKKVSVVDVQEQVAETKTINERAITLSEEKQKLIGNAIAVTAKSISQEQVYEQKEKKSVCLIRPTALHTKKPKETYEDKQEVLETAVEFKETSNEQIVVEQKEKKSVCLIRPTAFPTKKPKETCEEKQEVIATAVEVIDESNEQGVVEQKEKKSVCLIRPTAFPTKLPKETFEEKQEVIATAVEVIDNSNEQSVLEQKEKKSVCLIRPANLALKGTVDVTTEKRDIIENVVEVREKSELNQQTQKERKSVCLIRPTTLAIKQHEDPNIVKKKIEIDMAESTEEISVQATKTDTTEVQSLQTSERKISKSQVSSQIVSESNKQETSLLQEKSEVQESSFIAKSVHENVIARTDVTKQKIEFIDKAVDVTNSIEAKSIETSAKTKENLTLNTHLAETVRSDENNNIDTPIVPPTPLTDEYIFKLQIALPKGITPVPPDRTPTPEDEDPHIVKKKLVPHIDTTITSPIIFDPPLPTPPGSKVTSPISPVYTKPGLRGGGADKPIRKEEILEIERKSSLLASAIDQTIKSIEEYKEEVGIKKEIERRDCMESNGVSELKTVVNGSEKESDWSRIETKVTITNNEIDKLSNSIEKFATDAKSITVIDSVTTNQNGFDTNGIDTEQSTNKVVNSNSEESFEMVDENTIQRELMTEETEVSTTEETSQVEVKQQNEMNNTEIKEISKSDIEEKRSPMEGYRPVKFDPEEIQYALQNLKSAHFNGNSRAPPVTPSREMYKSASGQPLGTHQGIVDGLEEAVVDTDLAKELGKPGMTEEKIAELISGEAEMLREAHVMGLSRVLKSHMHREGDDSSVDFKKIKPIISTLKDSEVLKALNDEVLEEMMRERERKKKEELERDKDDKKWTTFLQKPQRPVPKVKFGYHGYVEPEVKIEDPYKVKIVKQPKPKVAPDYKPEETDFNTGLLPWEERALREPTPPPVEAEEAILIPEEAPELLQAVDPLPESELPDLEDSGIELPPPPAEESDTEVIEEAEEEEGEDLEAIAEEAESAVEENTGEDMEHTNIAEQLISGVQSMVDPNAPLEQQLSQMRAQIAALSQLPCVIQQSLEMVTRQLTQLSQMEATQTTVQKSEVTETTEVTEVTRNTEQITEETTQNSAQLTEDTVTNDAVNADKTVAVIEETKPSVTAEELERMKREEEEMLEEQRRVEKQKKSQSEWSETQENSEYLRDAIEFIKAEIMEQMRLEQESRQLKQRPTPRVGKPRPVFGPVNPEDRPVVLPGGRKWRNAKDVYDEQMLNETLQAQMEIINGKTVGLSFESPRLPYDERINFMKYEKPPVSLDHLKESETYKMIHHMEDVPLKKVEMLTPVVAESDYREKCRSMTPCDRIPQQVQP